MDSYSIIIVNIKNKYLHLIKHILICSMFSRLEGMDSQQL